MDIYERLEKDHDKQRSLIAKIKASSPGSEERSDLWTQLKIELEAHASAEEQAFYSKLMAEPEGTDDTRHAIEEHQQMHELIAEIDAMDPAAEIWDKKFKSLAHDVLHHVDEEEEDFFPDARETLSDTQEAEALKSFNHRKAAEVDRQEALAD
ncbi:MAG: hemerythrin domain-containing protein [Litorimonas sp.]